MPKVKKPSATFILLGLNAKELMENTVVEEIYEVPITKTSLKAPSLKAPSLKAPSLKAPSLKSADLKAPSTKLTITTADFKDGAFKSADFKTQITELNIKSKAVDFETVIHQNEHVKMWITMVDYINYGRLPNKTQLKCWYCHHSFETVPIGCPLTYFAGKDLLAKKIIKLKKQINEPYDETTIRKKADGKTPSMTEDEYYTDIDKKTALIERMEKFLDIKYFEVEGNFCSFPCCAGYIRNKLHVDRIKYNEAMSLLHMMYRIIFSPNGELKGTIPCAPDPIHMLKDYGGIMSIEEYREKFHLNRYVVTDNEYHKKTCELIPIGIYIEDRTKI